MEFEVIPDVSVRNSIMVEAETAERALAKVAAMSYDEFINAIGLDHATLRVHVGHVYRAKPEQHFYPTDEQGIFTLRPPAPPKADEPSEAPTTEDLLAMTLDAINRLAWAVERFSFGGCSLGALRNDAETVQVQVEQLKGVLRARRRVQSAKTRGDEGHV